MEKVVSPKKSAAEVTIIGGGLVGYTAALAFAQTGKSVLILEAKVPDFDAFFATEGRAIALAHTSCLLYQALGLWPALSEQAAAIKNIIISQQKSFGKCRISAQDYRLKALGAVIPATHLAKCLFDAVKSHHNIVLQSPYSVESIHEEGDTVCVNNELYTELLLACDGTQSFARQYFDIQTDEKHYEQHAVVANVTVTPAHDGWAVQRFTSEGVLALLPLRNNRMTSVLTLPSASLDALPTTHDEQYLKLLQSLLGKRQGMLMDLGKRFIYPLKWMQAKQVVVGRTVLLGNAAHTISPIAAQGLNLALRDLSMLYDLVMENAPFGNPQTLAQYAECSQAAQQKVMRFTDALTDWVKPKSLSGLRSAGLFALDHFSFLKAPLVESMMGISSHRGSLMRGDDETL